MNSLIQINHSLTKVILVQSLIYQFDISSFQDTSFNFNCTYLIFLILKFQPFFLFKICYQFNLQKLYNTMIKVKNLENVQDDDSITMDRLSGFISQMNSKTKNRLKSLKVNSKNNLQIFSQNGIESNGGNSELQMISKQGSLKKEPQTSGYNQYCQSYKQRKAHRQNGTQLKQLITEQKIKIIVKNFIQKLARNNINSKPIQFTPFHNDQELSFLDSEGIQLHQYITISISLLSAFQIVILAIIYTLSMVFHQVNQSSLVQAFQSFSLGFYIIEIFINFITVKFQEGKRLGNLRQIWNFYSKDNFPIDFISAVILIVDLFCQFQITLYFRMFIIVKLSQGLQKVQKLEVFFIQNFYKQQYWSLIKVFLFNFSFAHTLAIVLIAMTHLNVDQNWMDYKDIYLAPWFEKYAWAYYWATTMMLTVGFGDLVASTYQEAIMLTLVQMISCICLAYNINCVGTLISNIRSQDVEKSKNFKIFRKLVRKNDVCQDLEWRINNYIEESSNIKKKFNHQQEYQFVQKLPKGLKTQFLKQSNKKVFQNLPFFKNLMQRTLFSFAEKIQMHICHPQQVIQHIDDPHNLLILKGGQIGFMCKKPGCDYNSTVIDQLKILNVSEPVLVSLGFIRQNRSVYQIKSLQYSILYFLDNENILSILKGSQMDYQLYCLLRDKCSHVPDQYELFNCQICQGRHTKFNCPKLHFIPIKQHVANKFIHKYKNGKSSRSLFSRFQSQRFGALKIYLDLNQQQAKKNRILKAKKSQCKQTNNVLNQRKKFQQIDETSNSLIKQISDIKDFFSKNTAQLIKHQMNKALLYGEGHDEVWILQSDKMKNYKSYFQTDNSCNLVDKFAVQKRLRNNNPMQDFWSQLRSKTKIQTSYGTKSNINGNERTYSSKVSFKTLRSMASKKQLQIQKQKR